jgi:hypothetical protein
MTAEQQTLLADHYPEIFAAIKAAEIGISAKVEIQIDSTLLGNIARLWQVETVSLKGYSWHSHDKYSLWFTYESVAVNLYALIPKTAKR